MKRKGNMNRDKLMRWMIILSLVLGVLGISVGKWILGGIFLFLALAIWMNTSGGTFNERNVYEKEVSEIGELTIPELYELLRDLDTPLGRARLGRSSFSEGPSILFGPGIFQDYVAIYRREDRILLQNSTELRHIERSPGDEDYFDAILSADQRNPTPKLFSIFAAYKLMSAALTEDLAELIADIAAGDRRMPKSLECFHLLYANSSDNIYRDKDGNAYSYVFAAYQPMAVRILELPDSVEEASPEQLMQGEELALVTGEAKKEAPGYEFRMSGEYYGTMYRIRNAKTDAFAMDCPDGHVELHAFRAVRKGNLSCNYRLSIDGVQKAVIAGTARLRFANEKLTENSIICSQDDDYLVLYMAVQEFIMAKNKWMK